MAWLAAPSYGNVVPQVRLSGPMPWVIAIMVALTVIAMAAGLSLRNTARVAAADLAGGMTVQIVEASPERRTIQTQAALVRLRAMPGIQSARIVPDDQIAALIEPWIASGNDAVQGIPVPSLIEARVSGQISSERLTLWQTQLRQVAPAARVDAQAQWLGPVFGAIQSLQWLAVALTLLLALAMVAAVLLAVRTGLGAHRNTIETLHLLGGTDQQIAGLFQRSTAIDAAAGGAAGLALGLMVVLTLGQQFASLGAGFVDGGVLALWDWLILALVPVAGVVLATITARLTVLRALAKLL